MDLVTDLPESRRDTTPSWCSSTASRNGSTSHPPPRRSQQKARPNSTSTQFSATTACPSSSYRPGPTVHIRILEGAMRTYRHQIQHVHSQPPRNRRTNRAGQQNHHRGTQSVRLPLPNGLGGPPVAVEFAYNDSDHAGTGYTPFYLEYGYHPANTNGIRSGHASGRPQNMPDLLQHLNNNLDQARANLAKAQDSSSRTCKPITAGAATSKWGTKSGSQPTTYTCSNPSRPGESWHPDTTDHIRSPRCLSDVGYGLDLPPAIRIHPVIHVSHLKPYRGHLRLQDGPTPTATRTRRQAEDTTRWRPC